MNFIKSNIKLEEKLKDKIKKFLNTSQFHICMVLFLMFFILFVVGVTLLKYSVEGEGNLPFYLSKISVISTIEGNDVEDAENKWNLVVNQNNDIYLYIKKNDNYKETEVIESIRLDNFMINDFPKVGEVKLLKPDDNIESIIFKNTEKNEVDSIEFMGSVDSSIKELKISNQGGLVIFRYAINNIGNYISNEDEEINHDELLKKLSINNDDLKFKVSFDIYINLNSGKKYKSSIDLEFPVNDVANDGTQSVEYTDLENIVFKRI